MAGSENGAGGEVSRVDVWGIGCAGDAPVFGMLVAAAAAVCY